MEAVISPDGSDGDDADYPAMWEMKSPKGGTRKMEHENGTYTTHWANMTQGGSIGLVRVVTVLYRRRLCFTMDSWSTE